MDLSLTETPYIKLRRLHCEQFIALLTNEIEARHLLFYQHRQERSNFKNGFSYREIAMVIKWQISELMEFNAISSDKKNRLKQQQWQELQLLNATSYLEQMEK
ncbi:hypothetical protein [Dyadobacter sediminis]|uniref:Uncharacterized protein n=1 Tax=Dyadobacter sediminis TaxID=1493691 RepID=A0A5R9KMK6_9BACT|nr:hypothetical protein [Dyadobacter sediminis]TLU97462.1 hypothetical protein FEM55_00375 [Dyadobacter sediminis]GGC16074.1 hypothetical protein GCM10011325_48600 [Dyadobacter sediminis]